MKYATIIRTLGIALSLGLHAIAPAAAQDHPWSAEDLARFSNTTADAPRFHVDQPLPPGCTVLDDIVMPPAEGYAGTFTSQLWPGGVVPYTWDTNMSADNIVATFIAMLDWEEVANVDFRPWTPLDVNWIHIRNSDDDAVPACNSFVGKVVTLPGYQLINLATGCLANGSFKVHHELGHCLGFYHEQSRPDRDDYVTINVGNIQGGPVCLSSATFVCNFEKEPLAAKYGPYDFDSVMHYGQYDFSILPGVLTTIDVKPPNDVAWQSAIGQRDHLSDWDKTVMSFLYPESDWRFDNPGSLLPFSTGSFLLPWNKTFSDAVTSTPTGGTLFFIAGNDFDWTGTISKAITIEAPLGGLIVN